MSLTFEMQRIRPLVLAFVGCSEKKDPLKLGELLARGVDDPKQMIHVHTDCGTFMLGIWWAAGVNHPLLLQRYVDGKAIEWVRTIAADKHALKRYPHDLSPIAAAGLHYKTRNKNNDHVEFLLGPLDHRGVAEHGGGGRADNAIEVATSTVLWSSGRPLIEWFDPVALFADAVEPRLALAQSLDELAFVHDTEPPTNPSLPPVIDTSADDQEPEHAAT